MFWGNYKIVNSGSTVIEIGTMDNSKGSLEPVRGSKLPVKVGKDMRADEVRALAKKNTQITINFYRVWKTTYFFILIPNLCTIYLIQMSYLTLRNMKNSWVTVFKKSVQFTPTLTKLQMKQKRTIVLMEI